MNPIENNPYSKPSKSLWNRTYLPAKMPCSDTPQSTWLRITDPQKLKSIHGPICFDQPEMNPQWWVGKWEDNELAVSKQFSSLSSLCLRSYLSLFFSFFLFFLLSTTHPLPTFFNWFSISFSPTYPTYSHLTYLTHFNLHLHLTIFFLPPPLSFSLSSSPLLFNVSTNTSTASWEDSYSYSVF